MPKKGASRFAWPALAILAAVAWISPNARAAENGALPVTIGVQTLPDWLTIAARKFHLFEKVGLKPTYIKFTAGAPMVAAAASGSINLATPGLVPFLTGIGQGIPWVAIGIDELGGPAEKLVVRKGAGIKKLTDLRGKRIGYYRASTAQYGLFTALKQNHIPLDQVTLLSMAPAQQVAAMRAGEIDAAEVWEPWPHKMVAEANGRILISEADIGVFTADGFYAVRRDWLKAHRETARRILKAILLAYAAVKKDPKPAIEEFATETGIKEQWAAEIYAETRPSDIHRWADPNYEFALVKGSKLHRALDDLAAFLYENKIVSHQVDVSDVLDGSVISEVLKATAMAQ